MPSLACSTGGIEIFPAHFGPEETVHVSPRGRDEASGTREQAVRTIDAALSRGHVRQIILAPGRYPKVQLDVNHPLRIKGSSQEPVHLDLEIRGEHIQIHDLVLHGQIRIEDTRHAQLQNLTIHCLSPDCVVVKNSRLTAHKLQILGQDSRRSLWVESSTVSLEHFHVDGGGTTAQVLVRGKSKIQLKDFRLTQARGVALMVVGESYLHATAGEVKTAREFALVVNRSEARLQGLNLGASQNITVGIQGGQVVAENTRIEGSAKGTITLLSHNEIPGRLHLLRSEILHGRSNGLSISGGHARLDHVHFRGLADDHMSTGEDAITLRGPRSSMALSHSLLENSAGFAVSLYEGAYGTFSATITQPQLGGIFSQSISSEPIRIFDSQITNCRRGNGITSFFGDSMVVENTRVIGCARGGIVAGRDSRLSIKNAVLKDNRIFGIAAFGRAQITAQDVVIENSSHALFASCGELAQILIYDSETKQTDVLCP